MICHFFVVAGWVVHDTARDIHALGFGAFDRNASQRHKRTELTLEAAHVVRTTRVRHKAESGLVKCDLRRECCHWVRACCKVGGTRVEHVARSDSNQWFIALGDISLHMVELLHVLSDASIVVFAFQVQQCSEVCAVGPVFTLLRAYVNSVALVVIIHGVNTAGDVLNHHICEGVKAMLSVHFYNAEIAVDLAIEVQQSLHVLVSFVLVAVLQSLRGYSPLRVNERSLLIDKCSSACLFEHL